MPSPLVVHRCYHYEMHTRTEYYTDSNGNQQSRTVTETVRVNTWSGSEGWPVAIARPGSCCFRSVLLRRLEKGEGEIRSAPPQSNWSSQLSRTPHSGLWGAGKTTRANSRVHFCSSRPARSSTTSQSYAYSWVAASIEISTKLGLGI